MTALSDDEGPAARLVHPTDGAASQPCTSSSLPENLTLPSVAAHTTLLNPSSHATSASNLSQLQPSLRSISTPNLSPTPLSDLSGLAPSTGDQPGPCSPRQPTAAQSPPKSARTLKLTAEISRLEAEIAATQSKLHATLASLDTVSNKNNKSNLPQQSSPPSAAPGNTTSSTRNLPLQDTQGEAQLQRLQAHAASVVRRHIALLHAYNAIKDVGQGLLGIIADGRGVRLRDVMAEFGVHEGD